ncbi:MAG: ribonuclease III [Gammaproteobacteria bacterium]|nr:ribonuclease III [Gammaproteobacteria bacterium]
MQAVDKLCKTIDYTFKDPDLLLRALSHRSVGDMNYERLEFLGDSILNFIIAEALYLKYPHAQEGELSRLRASFVRGVTLAEVALELELGAYLRLGPGELKSGGRDRSSILADAFEALIGALYLDAGMDICKQKLLYWFDERLHKAAHRKSQKDPKTCLQEWTQAAGFNLPVYEVVKVEGLAHQQIFTVSCSLSDLEYSAIASQSTRRKAEQEAAAKILELIETLKK